jgi:hypothetical protein
MGSVMPELIQKARCFSHVKTALYTQDFSKFFFFQNGFGADIIL